MELMSNKPEEIGMGFQVDESKNVYFVFSDEKYFDLLFTQPFDGIAVDVIVRDQYNCGYDKKPSTAPWLYKGYLSKPLFLADIKANKKVNEDGYVYVKVMTLPKALQNKEVEYNLILLKNRYLCWYNTFYNLASEHWGLLNMGMYMDTLTEETLKENSHALGKRLKLQVPFAKDKYEYAAKDIKPFYDSLNLSKYDILSITIRAYSSVEGSTERNLELQQNRATSIIKALQTLQSVKIDSIKKEIIPGENWVEFYEDIVDNKFSYLSSLSKDEIKQKLNSDKALCVSLEPILKRHRKAVILLELVPKRKYKDQDSEKLKASFDQSLADKNISEALALQQEIFRRVFYHEVPENYLDRLEVPEQIDYGLIKNNFAAYKYQENIMDLFETLKQLRRLQDLMPNDHHIHYNICALQLQGWLSSDIVVDPAQLLNDILALNKMPVDKRLVKRLLINYHILNSASLMSKRKYAEKDKSLKYIYDNYAFLNLSDSDVLSLVQYFVQYGHSDWAKQFLVHIVKKIDANEDLLFYYINLTISNEEETSSKDYRAIMLNAINRNQKRYCTLFKSNSTEGGITFQLLENAYLKKTYCENCK